MRTLDKTKHHEQIFSSDPEHKARFLQNGLSYDAAGILIGDPVAILKERQELEVTKAREVLRQKEADLNTQAKELGLSISVVDVDTIRAEIEAKVRAEMTTSADVDTIRAEIEAQVRAEMTPSTSKVTAKAAPKKPGPQAEESNEAA